MRSLGWPQIQDDWCPHKWGNVDRDTPRKNAMLTWMCVHAQSLSHVQLFVIPWSIVHQAPLSMEFSRQEYWSGLSFPSPGVPSGGMENTILKYFKILLHHLWLPLFCWNVGCNLYYSSFKYSISAIPFGFFNDFPFIFDFQQLLYDIHVCGFPIIYTACGLPYFLNL